jgi:hypothetical protein
VLRLFSAVERYVILRREEVLEVREPELTNLQKQSSGSWGFL